MYLYDYGKLDEEYAAELNSEREHYGKTLTDGEVKEVVGATIKAETTENAQQRKATLKTIRTMLAALGYDEDWISNEVRPYAEDVYSQFRSPDEPLLWTTEPWSPSDTPSL